MLYGVPYDQTNQVLGHIYRQRRELSQRYKVKMKWRETVLFEYDKRFIINY